jgi:hypothetical protein
VVERRLRLNEFKELYKALKTGVVIIDYLFFSFIYWLENKVIENRSQQVVDEAIARYRATSKELYSLHPNDAVSPVYTEEPSASANSHSDTSTRLPEMRLTAPWYDDTAGKG